MSKYFVPVFLAATSFALLSHPANAVESYTDAQKQEFVSWCTGEKSMTETVCSCTVKQLAQTVPANALAQYLSSQGNFSLSATAVSTAAAVTQAMLACNK